MTALFFSILSLGAIALFIWARNLPKVPNNINPGGGYTPGPLRPEGFTPKANQYKIEWWDGLDSKINKKAREICKRAGVDTVDEQVMRQAILEVTHEEWVKLSGR